MSNEFDPENLNKNYGLEIDEMVKLKHEAKLNLVKASGRLLEMGAKLLIDGMVNGQPGLDVEQYKKWNFQEFAWEAVGKDGLITKQFENDGTQNHFGNIDQDNLSKFYWHSCFKTETDNNIREVVVTLDFKTGKFEFLNGQVPQAIRADADIGYPMDFAGLEVKPKLIMKMVKRNSETVSLSGNVSEVMKYNRYLIGWEIGAVKRLFCVEPNGLVHYWFAD